MQRKHMVKRKSIEGLTKSIMKCIKEKEGGITLQELYDQLSKSLEIPPERKEITYDAPNWIQAKSGTTRTMPPCS